MADIKTPYTDMVGTRPTFNIAPNKGDDPCAPIPSSTSIGNVTPKELPFNSLKVGTPDKGNSPGPKEY